MRTDLIYYLCSLGPCQQVHGCNLFGHYTLSSGIPQPIVVTFESAAPDLELPDSRYLKLHAAACRVAHMSGAAEYLDQLDRDLGEMGVLAHDGSSADLLASQLHRALQKMPVNLNG